MGIFNVFKKKRAPDTLPDLPMELSSKKMIDRLESKEESIPSAFPKKLLEDIKSVSQDSEQVVTASKESDEDGFFKEVIKNAIEETGDLDKLHSWYTKKFEPEDIVHQLREYWENQKPEILIKKVGKDVREKILTKTDKLDHLEKEWQEIYFTLLEKENEIRAEEKEIKALLSDLINIYQNSVKKTEKK